MESRYQCTQRQVCNSELYRYIQTYDALFVSQRTPLMFSALHRGHAETARFLVEMKADVSVRDACGDNARSSALTLHPPHSLHCRNGFTALGLAVPSNYESWSGCAETEAYLRSISAPGDEDDNDE